MRTLAHTECFLLLLFLEAEIVRYTRRCTFACYIAKCGHFEARPKLRRQRRERLDADIFEQVAPQVLSCEPAGEVGSCSNR